MEEKKGISTQYKLKPESKIDFAALGQAIKKHQALFYKAFGVAIVVGLVIGFSIPKTYCCQIILAPEMGTSSTSGTLGALASSFGIDLGSGGSKGGDAFTPSIYPDLMKSTDFKTTLFPIKVKRKQDKQTMTYYDYLKNEWKYPWWKTWFGLRAPQKQKDTLVNNFELTGEQAMIAGLINQNVVCAIDKKTNLINISATAQDPYVAALLADSVKSRLQDFLTAYKTSKARRDLEFAEKLNKQAKKEYERARRLYVDYMDANQEVSLMSAQQKQIDLENDMQLQYNNYTATSAQVIAARAKVQEVTPAFTPLQSASVPLGPSGPQKGRIVLICLFLAALFSTFYSLFKENQIKPLLGLS